PEALGAEAQGDAGGDQAATRRRPEPLPGAGGGWAGLEFSGGGRLLQAARRGYRGGHRQADPGGPRPEDEEPDLGPGPDPPDREGDRRGPAGPAGRIVERRDA